MICYIHENNTCDLIDYERELFNSEVTTETLKIYHDNTYLYIIVEVFWVEFKSDSYTQLSMVAWAAYFGILIFITYNVSDPVSIII